MSCFSSQTGPSYSQNQDQGQAQGDQQAVSPPSSQVSRENLRRIIASCMIGNALEWYDFVLCGYAAIVFSRLMFSPSHSPLTALLQTYGVFFSGFVMRPLGALLFGYIGDHYGRKKALTLSIYCMAIPTTLMGLLPTYAQIGPWAGVILAVLRMFQGLSMGGEFTGSMIFVVEQAPPNRQGLWGSFVSLSVALGLLVGSGLYAGIGKLTSPVQMETWGWRIPFLLSSVGSLVCFYMRKHLQDDHQPDQHSEHLSDQSFQESIEKHPPMAAHAGDEVPFHQSSLPSASDGLTLAGSPDGWSKAMPEGQPKPRRTRFGFLRGLVTQHLSAMVRVFFVDAAVAVGFFMVCVYVVGYLQSSAGFSYGQAAWTNTLAMVAFALMTPLGGRLCDQLGPVRVMYGAAWAMAVLAMPCFWGFASGHWGFATFCHVLLGGILGLLFAPVPAFLASMFPRSVRYSGVSLSHNLSMALFGGACPHFATFILHRTHWSLAPSVLVIGASFISLMALSGLMPKRAEDCGRV
jgi:MFS transporter, MHS family, proline/betaine transporter